MDCSSQTKFMLWLKSGTPLAPGLILCIFRQPTLQSASSLVYSQSVDNSLPHFTGAPMSTTSPPEPNPEPNPTPTPPPSPNEGKPSPERQANGRFAKGNSGGPGNPFARQVAELRRAVLSKVTKEVIEKIIDAMIDMACKGNV